MRSLFSICFWTGVLFTAISFVLGRFFDLIDIDGDFDFHGKVPSMTVSPLKPIIIVTFITVFGGIGVMSMEAQGPWTSLLIALIVAFLVSYAVHRWVVVPLYKAQNTSAVSQKELIGHRAFVTLGMEEESFGRITYYVCGNTYSSPAKSLEGVRINIGEEVEIVKIERNIFWVKSYTDNKEEE